MKVWTLGLMACLFFSITCNSYTPKTQGDNEQLTANNVAPDFATIQTQILQPYCISCHSSAGGNLGGVNLESYANVKAAIERIQDSVIMKGTMPPGNPISQDLQEVLTTWITNGEPEN